MKFILLLTTLGFGNCFVIILNFLDFLGHHFTFFILVSKTTNPFVKAIPCEYYYYLYYIHMQLDAEALEFIISFYLLSNIL